ncbi:hypothetical protein Mapa_003646 [Marchantia paleacea]|nr:hypothetical protein Mapa_003646 [Marchantia paleacea]
MTSMATGEAAKDVGSFMPEPRVVARAALCAKASYARDAARCFNGFEHLKFINVITTPTHEKEPSRSRKGMIRAVKRKMGVHRDFKPQRLLVASAQADDPSEVEVYVAFRGTAGWVDIFDDADFSQTSLVGFGDSFEGAVKGKFHNGFTKRLLNFLPDVNDIYAYVTSNALADGKKIGRLVFCGHSLGGAISHLAMLALFMTRLGPENVPTRRYMSIAFGAPHIGDHLAAEFFKRDFPVSRVLFTFVHEEDPVPFLLNNFPTTIKAGAQAAAQWQSLNTGATESTMSKLTSELMELGTITAMDEADDDIVTTNVSCLGGAVAKSTPAVVNSTANVYRMIMDAKSSLTEKHVKYAPIGQYLRLTGRSASLDESLAANLLSDDEISQIGEKLALDSNRIKAHYMGGYMIHLCPRSDNFPNSKSLSNLTVVSESSLEPVIKSAYLVIQGSDSAEIRVTGKNLSLIMRGGWRLKTDEPTYSFSRLLSDFLKFDDSNLQAEKVLPSEDSTSMAGTQEYLLKVRVQLPEEVKDAALYKLSVNRSKKIVAVGLKLSVRTSFGKSVHCNVLLDSKSFLLEPHSTLLSSLRKAMEKLLVITDAFSNSDATTRKIYDSILLGVKYGLPDHFSNLESILLSDKPMHKKRKDLFTDFFIPVDKLLCEALIKVRKNGHLTRFKKSVAGYYRVIDFLANFCREPSKFPEEILSFKALWPGLLKEDTQRETYESLEDKIVNYMPTGLADELKAGGEGATSFESSLSVKESVFAERTSNDILRWLKLLFGLRLVQQAIEKVQMVALVGPDELPEDALTYIFGVDESVALQHRKNVHFVEDGSTKLFVVHISHLNLPGATRSAHKKKQVSFVKSFDMCIVLVRSNGEEAEIRETFSNEFMLNYKKRCTSALIDKGHNDRVRFCHMEDVDDPLKIAALNRCGILSKHEIFAKIKTSLKLSGPSKSTVVEERAFAFPEFVHAGRSEPKKSISINGDSTSSKHGLLSGLPAAEHSLTR